ncbi:MAG TPA: hypothetical protein VMP01_09160 [Pirellulaceae bacterium]|nr:hypothetical protein [Pirellulaceae bacterium]
MRQWDWLVGGAAIGMGLVIAASAVANARWFMELRRPKWLAEKFGPLPTRGVFLAIGLICVALGVVIISGWRPPWAE